jgi:hypothetical protein
MARRTGGRGFWAGFFTGLAIVVLAGLALAWIYPPLQPPALDDRALEAPGAPGAPDGTAVAPDRLLTPAPGPVVEGLPGPDAPEEEDRPAPGSPSLVPSDDR